MGFIGIVGLNFVVCDDDGNEVVDVDCIIIDGDDYFYFFFSLNVSVEFNENCYLCFVVLKIISWVCID